MRMGFLRQILTDQRASDRGLVAPGGSSRRVLSIVSDRLCALTDIGRQRETNEDAVYASHDGCLLAVADGMGGEAAGEQASALSIEAVRAVFDAARAEQEIPGSQLLLRAFQHAQTTVMRASNEHQSWKRMGACVGRRAFIAAATIYSSVMLVMRDAISPRTEELNALPMTTRSSRSFSKSNRLRRSRRFRIPKRACSFKRSASPAALHQRWSQGSSIMATVPLSLLRWCLGRHQRG